MANEEWFKPGKRGIVCTVVKCDNGKIRLSMADVKRDGEHTWRHDVPITFKDFDPDEFSNVSVPEETLAYIGIMILSRFATQDVFDD